MSNINLKEVQKEYNNYQNIEEVRKAIRSVQTQKTRMKKQKTRADYNDRMNEILQREQILKEVRTMFEPKRKFVTEFTQEDVEQLNYEETMKAIKSIQSKKSNTQFLTDNIETNEEYQSALKIEQMLLEHKENVQPIEDYVVRKSDVETLINKLENMEDKIDKDFILEKLQELIN